MTTHDLIIIGGGASGLTAAAEYKRTRPGDRVLILERMPRVGKKLLVTGNGRCNLGNLRYSRHDYKNRRFAGGSFQTYDGKKLEEFFASLGLYSRADEEGRLYPLSNSAASVLDALRFECVRLGAEIRCDSPAVSVKREGGSFTVNGLYRADKLILAAGGKAAPAQGSDGSGFGLAESLGLKVTPLRPSLVQLVTDTEKIRSLKGIRVRAELSLDKSTPMVSGEVLFTDYGLSGIASMELSRYYDESRHGTVTLSLVPEFSEEELYAALTAFIPGREDFPAEALLTGFLPRAVGAAVIKSSLGRLPKVCGELGERDIKAIAGGIKSFVLPLRGTKGFADAQVTSGGIDVSEFDPFTLEAKNLPGLYACGEILDVDGGCGGFNLQWAFSSALTASRAAAGGAMI